MDYLKETYTQLVDVIQIGRSSQGRPIKVIKLSQNYGRDERKAIFIDAGKQNKYTELTTSFDNFFLYSDLLLLFLLLIY